MKKLILITTAVASYLYLQPAMAFLSDIDALEGKTVLYAGQFSEERCPPFGKYDCLKWPSNLLKYDRDEICFETATPICSGYCNGLLVVDKYKNYQFFSLGNIGGNVQKTDIQPKKCPNRF